MPAPVAGQRRLIELQRVNACTLLSLVSLLYSGQIDGNRKDVLSAAELLGIELPQEHGEETHGSRKRRREEQQEENNPQGALGQKDESLERSGREKEKIRESGTQTEREREMDERETQTDHICSDHQQNFHVIGHAACSSVSRDQGLHTGAPATVILQGAQMPPEKTSSSCDVLPVAPETGVYHVDGLPCMSSQRSHPHVCPLPLPPCSSSFCQNTMGTPDPPLLHTVSLPPAPRTSTQPMDLFLDDIMVGLNFLPPVHTENQTSQHGFMNTMTPSVPSGSKTTYPSMHSSVKTAGVSQQQPEGELCDILDHFLNTFEQHVGGCDLDVAEMPNNQSHHYTAARSMAGAQVNRDPSTETWSNVHTQLNPHSVHCHAPHANVSSHCIHASSTFTSSAQPQAIRSSPADTSVGQTRLRLSKALRRLDSSSSRGSEGKLENNEKEPEAQRVTRSQSMKRKLGTTLSSLQTSSPVKKCRRKRSSDTERPQVRPLHRQRKRVRCTVDMCISEEGSMSKAGVGRCKSTQTRSTQSTKSRASKERPSETMAEDKRRGANGHTDGSNVEKELVSASSWTPVKKTVSGAYVELASSAFEKMRMLLEKQRQRKEEHSRTEKSMRTGNEDDIIGTVEVQESASGTKEGPPPENTSHDLDKSRAEKTGGSTVVAEDEDRTGFNTSVSALTSGELGCRQENEESITTRIEQMMTNECKTLSQMDLLPNADPVKSTVKREESDCNNNEPMLSTAVSSQTTFDSKLELLLHSPPDRELLSHSPEKDMQVSGQCSEEEEEVDVLEVSSSASEPIAMPTVILEAGLSTEDEDVEEDTDVDVTGLESD